MRLKKIKLSGFKSFVDVTTVPVDTNLVGIVGPNGCGKSNVIDAVRWVMGESSAKQLRGDSMTDVIFNGTSTRKPVSQASIELVFDNTVSPLTGQYAKYTEIAIKRTINREGTSNYYMNNTKCRRKDLSDLFMGTGLGPRSYSIIEQGMISRVIEARPEDLRIYLEEAAGISKYKERRRETEVRIKHTKENLDRVNDIRDELGKQLDKLSKQSATAEQYTVFKRDLDQEEKYYLGLQYKQLDVDCKDIANQVRQESIALEQYNSQIESNNTEQERKKLDVDKLQHEQQEEQAKYYKIEQKINNIEQEIKHQESEKSHTSRNLDNVKQQIQYCAVNLEAKNADFEKVAVDLEMFEPEYAILQEQVDSSSSILQESEQKLAAFEKQWQEQQELISDNGRQINQSQALVEKHETLIVRTQKRVDTLREEQLVLKQESKNYQIAELRKEQIELITNEELQQEQLEQVNENFINTEDHINTLQEELNHHNNSIQAKKGRLTSLKTLQEHALGKDQKVLNNWLAANNLSNAKRLGEIIKIEQGWEKALEALLREHIKAVVLPTGKSIADFGLLEQDLNGLNIAFISESHSTEDFSAANAELLISKVSAPKEIAHLMHNIYCANDLEDAQSKLANLKPHEAIITKDGHCLNQHWFACATAANDNAKDSILTREKEISELHEEIEILEEQIAKIRQDLIIRKSDLDELKAVKNNLQSESRALMQKLSDIKSKISREESRIEQQNNRLFNIERDITDAIKHIEIDDAAVKTHRAMLEKALAAMERLNGTKSQLQATCDDLKEQVRNARSNFDNIKDTVHKSELNIQKLRQQRQHLVDEINKLEKQQARLDIEFNELSKKLETFDQPIESFKLELEHFLSSKHEQSDVLSQRNQYLESAKNELNIIDRQINELRRQYSEFRDKIEQSKIKQHEYNSKFAAVVERIQEKELSCDSITLGLPADLNVNTVRNKIKQLKQQIDDLGPVNLTAIDEYNTESARKNYLDLQEADLQEALAALEEAIAQIDQETKERFKETYDFVNEQFQYLFPKVFGGGRANLILSGDDLLDTGVTVMAQPPGKRNSSIHLLSGGEKALTAIALVFAIFRLNPAPFCMLDEVDAPLDDANVARYCNIVKEMSRDVQFIFITHNKVAMTMAQHLIGVTQNEPGVSRLVAVDLEQAVELADS